MNCLRVAVCRLRVSLGHPGSVVTDQRRYRLAQAVLECADTFQFTESLACAQRSATAQQRLSGYERALSHYSGDYLPL
ncbi:hypothetical protein EHF33_15020 [Deinococcus psychrotolerans]|uniref:Uncharacterized protein n=1 Tax=Deinococcus psychrotolerans TaxID=2489213 RepID=A0A3G8YR60_9DEIO|nr:hypothetical protein [Deinococcus psychrotolerans]AZI44211.1 hypothetical protein EHF33_15020 [Deinococcus psychrotolerans]